MRGVLAAAVLAVVPFLHLFGSIADALEGTVSDQKKKPLANALVYLVRIAPTGSRPPSAGGVSKAAIMDQYNKEFVPHVLPVQVGTAVNFPNRDNLKHHVYSNGVPKFDLPLYSGVPPKPIMFDKQGWVALGCNIHDWMVGHIYVLDTPHFAVTGRDGRWTLGQVPEGEYELFVWHPLLARKPDELKPRLDELKRRIAVTLQPANPEHFSLKLERDLTPARKPEPYQRDPN